MYDKDTQYSVDTELDHLEKGNLSPSPKKSDSSTLPTPLQTNSPASSPLCDKLFEHVRHALVFFNNRILLLSLHPCYLRNMELVRKDAGQTPPNEANLASDTTTAHTRRFFRLYFLLLACAVTLPLFYRW